jgi:hypothetical protein
VNVNRFKEDHLMRALRALCCAVAITACLAPAVRADEYNKQTFLTFSGPVQLPGLTLPAGTYMFKLADPSSGRSVIQVWDKEGTKLFTTLLTIPDQRMEVSEQPVVMFNERPSGEPQAIRAWFYPGDRTGMEFVYPKNQAMKIAQATNGRVLSFDDDQTRDETQLSSAHVGRVDGSGQMAENSTTESSTAQAASTTTADAPAATTAREQADRAASATADASDPVSNSSASAGVVRDDRAVGTSGSTANTQQSGVSAPATADRRELPRTAGSMSLVQMLSGLSILAAVAVRRFRTRHVHATR